MSCRIELMIRPYFTCFKVCFRVSQIQPFWCLQNGVFASIIIEFLYFMTDYKTQVKSVEFIIKYIEREKMSKQTLIQYTILDQKSFSGKNNDTLSKISQKSSKGFTFLGQSQIFTLTLNFLKNAIVTRIEIKVKDVESIQLYTKQQKRVKVQAHTLKVQEMKGTPFPILFQEGYFMSNLEINLCNMIPTESTIYYIIVKGITDEIKKTPKKVTNVSKDDSEFKPNKRPVGTRERQVFNDRKKTKEKSDRKGAVIINLQENTEEQQLLKVLEISKKQQLAKQKEQGKDKEKSKQREKDHNYDFPPIDQFNYEDFEEDENYQTIAYDSDVQKVVKDVTQEWIEAQKRAEKQLSVKNKHSLADKVNVRFFKNCKFCINNIFGSQKAQIKKLVIFLGGQMIEQPSHHCFILSNRDEGSKISTAKFMDGIKIIKPDYVKDCFKISIKLDYNDYKL